MLVLGIDTATLACSVALATEEKLIAEYTLQVKKTHSERLLPLIDNLLRDSGFKPRDLEGIAVAVGPGSFTGLRIGVATARALGQVLGARLAGVSTLAALSCQGAAFGGLVVPILDARRSQVYAAAFKGGFPPERVLDDQAVSLAQLLEWLQQKGQPALFVGDAVRAHRETIASHLGSLAFFPPPEGEHNRAAWVARLGIEELRAGKGKTYLELLPKYIRRSEAEVKYEKRCREKEGAS